MQPSLGAKIGEGATAEVYAWAPGRVLKLFRAGTPHHISLHEARMTRAVFAAGGLAPEVFEEVMVEGRAGLVMARLEGPTLMQVTKSKAVSYAQAGVLLAEGLHAVHQAPPPPDVPVLRDYMAGSLRRARGTLSTPVAAGVLALIDRLSPRDGLCHGDPNPGNMILTTEGPRLIDWIAAMRAPAALDLASAHVMLTELAPTWPMTRSVRAPSTPHCRRPMRDCRERHLPPWRPRWSPICPSFARSCSWAARSRRRTPDCGSAWRRTFRPRATAKRFGVLPQSRPLDNHVTVSGDILKFVAEEG
uniref:Phosphotransferase n=1 Tax=Phenylobacterium glaciei TaxID=2803784 RepID=A0A974S7D7_9CAUL|nr:phosphotransferase [Phenylobacterium glaciei]